MIPENDKSELTKLLEEKQINFTPSIEIRIDRLEKIPLFEFEQNNQEGAYNQVRKALKPVCNFRWDSPVLRVTNIYGDEFSFSVYRGYKVDRTTKERKPTGWEITIWDYKGSTTIGKWHVDYVSDQDTLSKEDIKKIKKKLEEFSRGILHCSACDKKMPIYKRGKFDSEKHDAQYGGQYFAGHYCDHCWETKYRAIEAKETYE